LSFEGGVTGFEIIAFKALENGGRNPPVASTFVRTRPRNDHPTVAILAVQAAQGLAEVKSYRDIAKSGTVRNENKTVTIADYVQDETERRHYARIACPGHADYIKNMITVGSDE
jgi:hypothetical protein